MPRGPGDCGYRRELKVRGQRKVGREYFLPGDLNIVLLCDLSFALFFVFFLFIRNLHLELLNFLKTSVFWGYFKCEHTNVSENKDCCLCNRSGSDS